MAPEIGSAKYHRIRDNLREGKLTEDDIAELQRLTSAIDRASHHLSVALGLKPYFEEAD